MQISGTGSDRHGAEPTIYGAALLKHGLAAFDELRQSVKEIEYLADPTTGELRIATNTVIGAGFLSAVIEALHRRHPSLTIHVKLSVVVDSLYRELRDRNIDLILERITTPFLEHDLQAEILFNEATVIVAGIANKWTRRRKIELAELTREPWVFPAEGSVASVVAAQIFKASGLEMPHRGTVWAPMPVAAALVANGPYLANLPRSLVRYGKSLSVKVLPVKVPILPSPVGIITVKGRTMNPVAQLFIEHARGVAKPLTKSE